MFTARLLCSLAIVGLATACKTPEPLAPLPAPAPVSQPARSAEPIHLTLVATNDLHGWVQPQSSKLPDGTVVEEGGVAALAGYLAILRARNPGGVLLLDGGDMFQGTLASNLTEGEVVIAAMNHLGYTAAALGNHEFDYGPVGPESVALDETKDAFGALKARLAQARFPLLAVNVYDARTGTRPSWLGNDGTTLVEVQGVKVGIVGFITPSTPFTTNPVNVSTLRFGNLVPEAPDAVARLRAQGAEVIVAVAHAGGKCGDNSELNDLSSCDTRDGEIFELLQGVPPGLFDAVIGGHTHQELAKIVNGTPLVETRGLGRAFATIDLFVDPKTRKVIQDRTKVGRNVSVCARVDAATQSCDARVLRNQKTVEWRQATFMDEPVKVDEALQQMLKPALARVEQEQQRKLGVSVPRTLTRNYESESPLGDFLADSLRRMERADVALLNPGGLRADLPAGELAYGDVYEVLPFDNTVATLTLTGEELKRLLYVAYGGRKGVFQVSGLKLKLNRCPGQGRLRDFTLENGKPIHPEKRYRVVLPDFLARGGDGLGPVTGSLPPSRVDLGMSRPHNFRDALVDFWQSQGTPLVAPPPGRIAFVDGGTPCSAGDLIGHH